MLSFGREREIESIDMRRRLQATGPRRRSVIRWVYLAVLCLTATAALASVLMELDVSFTASSLPVNDFSFNTGARDSLPGWQVSGVAASGTVLRDGDLIVAIDDVPALTVLRSDSLRRAFDQTLKAGDALPVTIVRKPTFHHRQFWAWKFLVIEGGGGGPYVRSAVVDSTHAGLGLEAALRAYAGRPPPPCDTLAGPCPERPAWIGRIPPDLDLKGAETALTAYDSTLRVLPVGTRVQVGNRGDDIALPWIAVTPPPTPAVQIEEVEGRWVTIPSGRSTQSLDLVRRPWTESATALILPPLLLLVAVVGLLSLRARTQSAAVEHFVALCVLLTLVSPVAVFVGWNHWAHPISTRLTFGEQSAAYLSSSGDWHYGTVAIPQYVVLAVILGLGTFLVWYSALRLLHTFPSSDADLEVRYRVPRWGLLASVVLATASSVWFTRAGGLIPSQVWTVGSLLFVSLTAVLISLVMMVQVARLAVARWRQPRSGDEAMQGRLALSGLTLGSVLLLAIWFVPTAYVASHP